MKWHKAKLEQEMGDSDEILAIGIPDKAGNRWYEVLLVRCDDEDGFELRTALYEDTDISWDDIDYWCYTKDIPLPVAG